MSVNLDPFIQFLGSIDPAFRISSDESGKFQLVTNSDQELSAKQIKIIASQYYSKHHKNIPTEESFVKMVGKVRPHCDESINKIIQKIQEVYHLKDRNRSEVHKESPSLQTTPSKRESFCSVIQSNIQGLYKIFMGNPRDKFAVLNAAFVQTSKTEQRFRRCLKDPKAMEALFQTGWLPNNNLFFEILGKEPELVKKEVCSHVNGLINGKVIDPFSDMSVLEQLGILLSKHSLEDGLLFIKAFNITDLGMIDRITKKGYKVPKGYKLPEKGWQEKLESFLHSQQAKFWIDPQPDDIRKIKEIAPDDLLAEFLSQSRPVFWLYIQRNYFTEWNLTIDQHISSGLTAATSEDGGRKHVMTEKTGEQIKPLLLTVFKFRDPYIRRILLQILLDFNHSKHDVDYLKKILKYPERQQLVALLFYTKFRLSTQRIDDFNQSLEEILKYVKSFSFLKDSLKLRRFLSFFYDVLSESSLSEKEVLDLILTTFKNIKNSTNKSNLPHIIMKKMELLSIFSLMNKTDPLRKIISGESLNVEDVLLDIFQQVSGLPDEGLPKMWMKYNKMFEGNLNRPIMYWIRLRQEKGLVEEFQTMLALALNDRFQKERYDLEKSKHLSLVIGSDKRLLENWQTPLTLSYISSNKKTFTCDDTDGFREMLFMGHVTESCQSTSASASTSKGLLGIKNGRTRMICVQDETGNIVARALIRLIWNSKDKEPILLLEKVYNARPADQSLEEAILKLACRKAKLLGLCLVGSTPAQYSEFQGLATFEEDVASFEYSDTDTTNHMHSGDQRYQIKDPLYIYFDPFKQDSMEPEISKEYFFLEKHEVKKFMIGD